MPDAVEKSTSRTADEARLTRALMREAGLRRGKRSKGEALAAAVRAVVPYASNNLDELFAAARHAPSGPIQVVDIFSGCGGMSAGFLSTNGLLPAYRLLAAADIDATANATYRANLGLEPALVDVHEMARRPSQSRFIKHIEKTRDGSPLVLIGCAPCQGFSSHRNSAGRTDPRNGLFADFVTLAIRLQPDVIVGENVPELLTDAYWPHVKSARDRLERAGYFVHLSVHNMAEFGVPQQRFRVLLLAARQPIQPPVGFLDNRAFRTVREAIGHLPPIEPGTPADDDPLHVTAGHRQSTIDTIRVIPHDGGSRPPWEGPASLQRIASRQGKPAYEDVYGRLWWDRPAITITAYARNPASGRFCHPDQDRGLSIREGSLLQGFPGAYHFEGTLDPCFRQIGNAVPPKFSAILGVHVLGALLGADYPKVPDLCSPVGSSFSRLIPSLKASARAAAPRSSSRVGAATK